jgi:outer membrane protein assembly factor BamB
MKRWVIFGVIAIFVAGLSQPAKGQECWGLFRGDPALTGVVRSPLPKKIKMLWRFKATDDIKASPVVCGNYIAIGSLDGTMHVVDLNGKLVWKDSTGNGFEAPGLIIENTLYAGNLSGDLFAWNLITGKRKWVYKTEGQISGSPNAWKAGTSTKILVGSYDYYLHCVDASSGKGLWKYESDNFINGAASCIDNKAIFGGCDGFLHLVDITTGQADAKINVATYVPGSVPITAGLAFVGDYDGGFTCVNLKEQKIAWKYSNDKVQLPFLASAAVSGEKVVTGSRDKNVYCFDKTSGKVLWKFNSGERVDASPLISGDQVLVANMRGDLILLRLSDGTPVWTYESGTPINGNPAVAGGRVYFGGEDGYLYCVGNSE